MTICLRAAFADGESSEAERVQIKRIVDGLSQPELNMASIYQDVILKRGSSEAAAAQLDTPELRQLAYEMAVCTCEADGLLNDAEKAHLAELRRTLSLSEPNLSVHQQADSLLSVAPVAAAASVPPVIQRASVSASNYGGSAALASAKPTLAPLEAELDRSILNYSVLNGALELLPDSLATMAIIPLQMKMVYEIGKRHGYDLDRGHVKEFLAAAGVGITSQVLEGYATKLARGLFGKIAGGLGRMVAGQVTGSAMAFATTYALGNLAKQYYAGGRTLSGIQLRDLFGNLLGEAQRLQPSHLADIQARSRTLSRASLLELARQA